VDFGTTAKEFEETMWLMMGMVTYMAPESVASVGQSEHMWSGMDWSSSSCVLYEMMTFDKGEA